MAKKIIEQDFIEKLEAMALHLKQKMQGYFGGSHIAKTYGNTVEFADFREYALGDDLRRIDWNLFSRFEKYYIKLFVDERQMHNQIFIDCSLSMGLNREEKFNYALKTAAAIGFLSVQCMDKISYKLIEGKNCRDLCGVCVGKEAFYSACKKLEEVKTEDTADIESAVIGNVNPGYNDGLTVIISDFLTESNWKKAVDFLINNKRQVLLIQVLSPEDIKPDYRGKLNLIDSESVLDRDDRNMKMRVTPSALKAYDEALKIYLKEISTFCSSRSADYILARTDEPVQKVILQKMFEAEVLQ